MAVPGGMPMKLASGLRWGIWVWCGLACGGFFISNGMAQTAAQPNRQVARILLSQHNMQLRYFRHPYLDTGRDLETRRQAEAFLVARGYRIAPVTVDAWDWMYGGVYEDAKKRGDTALQQKLVKSYLSY